MRKLLIATVLTLLCIGIVYLYFKKPLQQVTETPTLINILRNLSLSAKNLDIEGINTLSATDENFDTCTEEILLSGGGFDVETQQSLLIGGEKRALIKKLAFKIIARNEKEGNLIPIGIDVWGHGVQKTLNSTQTEEQVFQEEVDLPDKLSEGTRIYLLTPNPEERVWLKICEIQLWGS